MKMTYDPSRYSTIHRVAHEHGFLDWRLGTGGIAEIVEIEVDSDHRRKHIGEGMMQRFLSAAAGAGAGAVYAFTRQTNKIAQQFYVHQGFKLTPLPGFYPDGDAVIVWRSVR